MRQLPVLAAFRHTVRSSIDNFRFAFHISWPWMLLLLPFNIAANLYSAWSFKPVAPYGLTDLPPDIIVIGLAMFAASFVAFGSIAVAWHRYVLADEVPHGFARLRMDATVWSYVGNAIIVAIASALAGLVIMFPFVFAGSLFLNLGNVGIVVGAPLFVAGFICAMAVSMRLGLKLPAIAMGNNGVSLSSAWAMTQGNHWRCGALFAMVVACIIAIGLTFGMLAGILTQSESAVSIAVLVIIQMAVNWASTIWNVTLLTSLYGYYVEGRDF